jgi:cytochrome c553
MTGVVQDLTDEDILNISAYVAAQPPAPTGGTNARRR